MGVIHLHHHPAGSTAQPAPESIDLPLPHAILENVRWQVDGDHLVVTGLRIPYDRLADPECRRPEWFEHRLALRVAAPGIRVRLVDAVGGPHLLVG